MSNLEVAARRLLFDLAVVSFHGKTSLTIQRPRPPMLELATSVLLAVPGAWNPDYRALVIIVGPWVVAVFDLPNPGGAPWSVEAGQRAGAELVRLARGAPGRGRGRGDHIDVDGTEQAETS